MASLFEAPQLGITELPEDLHYRLTDPGTGAVLAQVAPVVVGRSMRGPRGLARLKRFVRHGMVGLLYKAARYHVPRITFCVTDVRNSTLFYIDRAEKLVDNPAIPQSAVVDPSGGVLGYLLSDHYQTLDAMNPPVDAHGIATVSGRHHLRNRDHEVVGEVVLRVPWTKDSMQRGLAPGDPAIRIVAPDGAVWAWSGEREFSTMQIDPRAPQWLRALLIAQMVAGRLEKRLHKSLFARYRPPAPLDPTREPYPGFRHVHSSYMRYQEEVTQWFREEIKRRNWLVGRTQPLPPS